jgi:hypothetical protein
MQDALVDGQSLSQKAARGIQLEGQADLGEIHLHRVGTFVQTLENVFDRALDKVGKEDLTRITFDAVSWVEQAHCRGADHGLLDLATLGGERLGLAEVIDGPATVRKGSFGDDGQLTEVTVGKVDPNSVRFECLDTGDAVGGKRGFALLSVSLATSLDPPRAA